MLKVKIKKQLDDFTLDKEWEVGNGEIVTLFGPSGSGKSITVKYIAGLVVPDDGKIQLNDRILFHGKDKINLTPQERAVGYVPQHYGLFPHLTIIENITFGIKIKDKAQKREMAQNLLERVGLQHKEGQYPNKLSGGEKQRIAIIRALATDPKVLLLDEPFSAIDALLRQKLREEIKEFLGQWKIPVVLVTHDPEDVSVLGTKVVHY